MFTGSDYASNRNTTGYLFYSSNNPYEIGTVIHLLQMRKKLRDF